MEKQNLKGTNETGAEGDGIGELVGEINKITK